MHNLRFPEWKDIKYMFCSVLSVTSSVDCFRREAKYQDEAIQLQSEHAALSAADEGG